MRRYIGYLVWLTALIYGCQNSQQKRFVALSSSETGIEFSNTLTATPELNILNYLYFFNGAGIAAADFNNDGLTDLYFTSNQEADQLYLNQGNFKFKNVTELSGINNTGNWTTGVTHVDINHDGLMDLYICKIGNYRNISGKNLLFINQGIDEAGIPKFKESAASYGLDFSGFSTQAAFFDYDLDGDLDMFLLNHSVHPNRTYGKGAQRLQFDAASGDRLFKNEEGVFRNVSDEAGIFQGRIGYGLGLAVSDLNNDGYPDIYVGNDFFENDYLYINQKDGSFREIISSNSSALGHTTHYSMGNDIADINNDGLTDIISLDMLPEDLETYKTSGLEYPYPVYQYYLQNGYSPQYMQNTLHLNLGNNRFSEIGFLAGIAATEWSWSALLTDFDNDAYKDLYITNGIQRATNDMDFISFIANNSIQKRLEQGMSAEDMSFIKEIPQKKVSNYFLKNNGNLQFLDETENWFEKLPTYSNGAIYADLDNDGDQDIVVNNIDENATVLKNLSRELDGNNYAQFSLQGNERNPAGIGSKIWVYTQSGVQLIENYATRGFMSSIAAPIHFGLGNHTTIDSVRVLWPSGKTQVLKELPANKVTLFKESEGENDFTKEVAECKDVLFAEITSPVNFQHKEPATLEFNRDPLVPFATTNEGPAISVADVNKDGLDDLFISGAKAQPSQLFLQKNSGDFELSQAEVFQEDALSEDVSHVFFDANGDSWPDLVVVSGGNEFQNGPRLRPRLYLNKQGQFTKDSGQFQDIEVNASKVSAHDIDGDGDLDILIASDMMPLSFGSSAKQYVYINNGSGSFTKSNSPAYKSFIELPSVKDLIWVDIDGDGSQDLISVGYWEPIRILKNEGGIFKPSNDENLKNTNGWWNVIRAADLDQDGDMDLIAGNWGLNTKLKASEEFPITLYNADFDDNGTIDPIVTYFEAGVETPFASKEELTKQLPFLNKKYLSYATFAKAEFKEILPKEKIDGAEIKQLYELASIYLENDGKGNFTRKALPLIAQISSAEDILIKDFNNDGGADVLIVGNRDEISTQLGRMDASHGIILLNDKKGNLSWRNCPELDIRGAARSIESIRIKGDEYFIIGINNNTPQFLINHKENDL